MNTKIKDGGPAFPVSFAYADKATDIAPSSGLTMRDYFAAKIAPAYLAYIGSFNSGEVVVSRSHKEIAEESYSIADAMLAAREVQS